MTKLLLLAVFIFPLVLIAGTPGTTNAVPAILPPVTAHSLDKSTLKLPADFSAPLNLLILSFTRDQQSAVDTWLPVVIRTQSSYPKVQPWVIPVSAKTDTLYKWWMNSSMRNRLPNDESEHFTVPFYVDKAHFLKSLAIPSEKEVVVLITNRTGVVLWRSEGSADSKKEAALDDFLQRSALAR